jgi:hypothetical protein
MSGYTFAGGTAAATMVGGDNPVAVMFAKILLMENAPSLDVSRDAAISSPVGGNIANLGGRAR